MVIATDELWPRIAGIKGLYERGELDELGLVRELTEVRKDLPTVLFGTSNWERRVRLERLYGRGLRQYDELVSNVGDSVARMELRRPSGH